jgi:hypothetical protein
MIFTGAGSRPSTIALGSNVTKKEARPRKSKKSVNFDYLLPATKAPPSAGFFFNNVKSIKSPNFNLIETLLSHF